MRRPPRFHPLAIAPSALFYHMHLCPHPPSLCFTLISLQYLLVGLFWVPSIREPEHSSKMTLWLSSIYLNLCSNCPLQHGLLHTDLPFLLELACFQPPCLELPPFFLLANSFKAWVLPTPLSASLHKVLLFWFQSLSLLPNHPLQAPTLAWVAVLLS